MPPLPLQLIHSVPKRKAEFLAGRYCAVNALERLGLIVGEIAINPDRSPAWPCHTVGSISHTEDWAGAIAAPARFYRGLGLDGERLLNLEQAREVRGLVMDAQEDEVLSGLSFELATTVAFSAKEALFKALFPTTREMMEFHDATIIRLAGPRLHFAVNAKRNSEDGTAGYSADWTLLGGMVVCTVAIAL